MNRARVLRSSGIALAVLAPAGAYAEWTLMPWLPRFVAPTLAAVGAVVVSWAVGRSVVQATRRDRTQRRVRAVPLALGFTAVILLVVLPLMRLPAVLGPGRPGNPRLLSTFGDWLGAEGYPRLNGRHRGVDLAGPVGSPVLAPADGRVVLAKDNGDSCGLTIVLDHGVEGYRTIYCHLSRVRVAPGDAVARGSLIGAVGATGMRGWPGYDHLHWELRKGRGGPHEDPLAHSVGCFDGGKLYPTERLVLTYPVPC